MQIFNLNIYLQKFFRFRKLFFNFSFRSFANVFSKLIGLITLPIIARALGPEAYGNYNLVNIVVHYTSFPIALLGLRSYGIREISANRKEKSYALEIISMQLSVAIAATIISLLICSLLFQLKSLIFIAILIGFIQVYAASLDLEFFYVSQKDLVFPTMAQLIGQLFYMGGVILFIKKPTDFPLLVLLASLTLVISDIIQLKKYNTKFYPIKIRLSFKETMNTFRKTYKLGISQNLEGFLPSIPQVLLSVMIGNYSLGVFAGGYKVYSILVMFYVTLFYALAPYLVKLNEYPIKTRRKYHLLLLTLLLFAGSFIAIVLFFFGESITLILLGKGFGESVEVFKVISLTLIPMTPVIMLFGNILIYSSKEKYYLLSLIWMGVTMVLSAPILIKYFQAVGAVYAFAISNFVGLFFLMYYYFKLNSSKKWQNAI